MTLNLTELCINAVASALGIAADVAPEKEKPAAVPENNHRKESTHMLQQTMELPASNGKGSEVTPLHYPANATHARRGEAWLQNRLHESKSLGKSELISEVITLTPAMAELMLLKHNAGNRPIRQKRVEIYKNIITEGRWRLSSQGISFSRDGALNNGQHRLSGIVAAGRPVLMMVVFGEDKEVFDILDTGATRGGSDVLHVAGYKNTKCLAAAARLLRNIENEMVDAAQGRGNDEMLALVRARPGLEEATTAGMRIGQTLRCSTGATTVAVYLIRKQSSSARRFDQFVERLVDGTDLKRNDPILVLRDGLTRKSFGAGQRNSDMRTAATAAAIIKAWNQWVRGRTSSASSLGWTPAKPFPQAD